MASAITGDAKASGERPASPATGRSSPFHQLVELQKQIIELVDQNSAAERRCRLLRQQLAREAEAIFVRSTGLRRRFRHLQRAAGILLDPLHALLRRGGMAAPKPGRIEPPELNFLHGFSPHPNSDRNSTREPRAHA